MAKYKVTNITNNRGGVGFSIEGNEDYLLVYGEYIFVTKITQELRHFEEVGAISIDVVEADPGTVVDAIICNDTVNAPSGRAVCDALSGKEAAGTAAAAISVHELAADPHPQYAQLVDIGGGGGGGGFTPKFERIVLTGGMISAKKIPLNKTPVVPSAVQLIPDGGIPQRFGVDYTVSGATLSWDSLQLDGFLETNEVVDVFYDF
jgi:hypothetical protein